MPISNAINRTASLTEAIKTIAVDQPDLAVDVSEVLIKRGIISRANLADVFLGGKMGTLLDSTTQPSPQTESPPTNFEIDTRLQLLINAIPIANPGNIITSEYHNALRDAVRALASRIGLSVNPTAEYKKLTFAPAFLPLFSLPPRITTTSGATAAVSVVNPNRWDVTLNRAAIPNVGINFALPVQGGIAVQLPDGATVFQMIVRGARLEKDKSSPEEFTVALKRGKFGTDPTKAKNLISINLKGEEGAFKKVQRVEIPDKEKEEFTNSTIARLTVEDLQVVDNENWIYYVIAEWSAGEAGERAAKFEINSIQIFCTV